MPISTPPPSSSRQPWRSLRTSAAARKMQATDLATHVLNSLGITSAPVDVVAVARRLGAEVYRGNNLGGVLAALDSTKETPTIWVNTRDGLQRQRFSIAHEIGHLLMHPLGRMLRDESYATDGTKPEETEANEFASHLLMPLWLLQPYVIGSRMDTKELANLFNVSVPAMRWQLAKLV